MVDKFVQGRRAGLPQRTEFRRLFQQWQQVPVPRTPGKPELAHTPSVCLLVLRVPRNLMATDIVASLLGERLRSRDTLARLGPRGLGVLLRQCTVTGAEQILGQLLGDLVEHQSGHGNGSLPAPRQLGLRHRLFVLRAGVTAVMDTNATEGVPHVKRLSGDTRDPPALSCVVNNGHVDSQRRRPGGREDPERGFVAVPGAAGQDQQQFEDRLSLFRGEPGVRFNQVDRLACLRLRSLQLISESTDQYGVTAALAALSRRGRVTSPDIQPGGTASTGSGDDGVGDGLARLPMLIVPMSGPPVNDALHAWLIRHAAEIALSRGELCLAFPLGATATPDLPVVRKLAALRRAGYRLMLQQSGDAMPARQYRRLPMDLLCLSSRSLQAADTDPLQRARLNLVVVEAHAAGWLVSINGVDSEAMQRLAVSMGVDLGFGRWCGRSQLLQRFLSPAGTSSPSKPR